MMVRKSTHAIPRQPKGSEKTANASYQKSANSSVIIDQRNPKNPSQIAYHPKQVNLSQEIIEIQKKHGGHIHVASCNSWIYDKPDDLTFAMLEEQRRCNAKAKALKVYNFNNRKCFKNPKTPPPPPTNKSHLHPHPHPHPLDLDISSLNNLLPHPPTTSQSKEKITPKPSSSPPHPPTPTPFPPYPQDHQIPTNHCKNPYEVKFKGKEYDLTYAEKYHPNNSLH
jgi:hypothetical protein